MKVIMSANKIRLVIFDWAGTTIDHGCFAPISAFIKAFQACGVELTPAQARGPMGLHKKDHIRSLFQLDQIAAQWEATHERPWSEEDVEQIYQTFMPLQVKEAQDYTDLVPGLCDTISRLRERGIKIGSTTGYPRIVAEPVLAAAKAQGYDPDYSMCADEVPAGRPAPWMIYRNMEALNVFPPTSVVKVGDTVPDIEAGLNAGTWTVGLTQTGSEVGLTVAEFEALDNDQKASVLQTAETKLKNAGAHFVIPTLKTLPEIIEQIEAGAH
ncbi:phosphonoacetaldehyde hydrolase [Gimesia fumaroli]|uniref:phosphonoacetaldehyde hydrolase n=1 Tax=Gimesia fumaroli TaxID=2527976 RepID=A0A518I4W6_9PLAN|nr:phosphonoacetaldehyde hydrolase [Gimesia fumaroli]QDV48161.1 Phosphonoacetaldehyde hydrolase [Gimesia fumaroli]